MYTVFLPLIGLGYVALITYLAYRLGKTKSENPKVTAMIGFGLAFIPPLALIYLAVLVFKDEVDIV